MGFVALMSGLGCGIVYYMVIWVVDLGVFA